MGTRGILYIYFKSEIGDSNYLALRLKYDSKIQLIELRKKFLRIKTLKALEKFIDSLEEDENLYKEDEAPEILSAAYCWPFLEYSLEVTVEQKVDLFQVLVDLVRSTISETEFEPVKGQRKQDRRSPEQKAADKAAKAEREALKKHMIEWSDDGIHGHELCLQREWTSELKKTTDSKRKAQLTKLIEESKARLPQKKVESPTCQGCIENQPGQLAHMEVGGCLEEELPASPKPKRKPGRPKKEVDPNAPVKPKRKPGRPKKILTEEEQALKKEAAALKQRERRAAKKAADALLKLKSGPGPNAPRSQLAPWIATQN